MHQCHQERTQGWRTTHDGDMIRLKGLLPESPPVCRVQVAAARHTAALVIAKVAAIELPQKQWLDLISTLLANMGATPPSSGRQQATLQALGYICEEMGFLTEDVLAQEQVNSILTAVVQVRAQRHPLRPACIFHSLRRDPSRTPWGCDTPHC